MLYTIKIKPWIAGAGILLVTSFASTGASALEISPIPPAGAPAFINGVKVNYKSNKGTFNITGKQDFKLDNSSLGFENGTNLNYTLKYDTNSDSGSLSIRGRLPGLGIDTPTLLVTADVSSFGFDGSNLLGFGTSNIVCDAFFSAALSSPCTTNESVYVVMDAFSWAGLSEDLKTTGTATTTIPLPAAVWLFGSGLALLGVSTRRKRLS